MKTIPIQLLNSNTRAMFIWVRRSDGQEFGFTSCDVRQVIPINGNDILFGEGMNFSVVEQTIDLNANNGELTFIPNDVITVPDLLTGVWNNFEYLAFEADWVDPQDIDIISAGSSGEVQVKDGKYIAETRGLKQALRNPQGFATQATCRARFADYPTPTKPNILCTLDPADWTVTGTVTATDGRRSVTDSSRTEETDWFGMGIFEFTSGDNAGQGRLVSSYDAGVFVFDLPFDYQIQPGDAYKVIAGCRKRHDRTLDNPTGVSDCLDKFDNVLNFQGEPHTPGGDKLTQGAGDA